jgi:3-hydroxy acid dehydrogenase/malonic semialdehyde reductase
MRPSDSIIKGQTVFITGASSGIGKACAEQFAAIGANLVITARRLDRLENLGKELESKHGVKVTALALDVQDSHAVEALFLHLKEQGIPIDILVNNAGLALSTDLMQNASFKNWDIMIDTNIKGLLYTTRCALESMTNRNRGHIINIGSVAGHGCYLSGNIYCATKHAVRAISKSLRLDLMGTALRVSEVDPGAVHTEFSEVRFNDKTRANKHYEGFSPLLAEDIADAVIYCATRPPHVNISEIVVFPQAQASLTDIYREGQEIKSLFPKK